nr:hypothetical protein [Tanacetum cinerariifolium]
NVGLKNSGGNSKHNKGVEWRKKNSKSNTSNGFAQGSAGAGSVLRRLRSAKIAGKACDRAEGSPHDDRGGNMGVGISSSKDGKAIAETNILKEKGIAGSGTSN